MSLEKLFQVQVIVLGLAFFSSIVKNKSLSLSISVKWADDTPRVGFRVA